METIAPLSTVVMVKVGQKKVQLNQRPATIPV